MKLLFALALVGLCGCYAPRMHPLQPGEKIVFGTAERAAEFRTYSGNDQKHTGQVVTITRPTSVSCE